MYYEKKALERLILKTRPGEEEVDLLRVDNKLCTFVDDVTGNSYTVVKLKNVEAVTIGDNYIVLDFGRTQPAGMYLE